MLMPFFDESSPFAYGFECGQIWTKMERGEEFENYIFHKLNQRQVVAMCQRFGYSILIQNQDEFWSKLTATKLN